MWFLIAAFLGEENTLIGWTRPLSSTQTTMHIGLRCWAQEGTTEIWILPTNAMQRLGDLFDLGAEAGPPRPETTGLLRNALWLLPTKPLGTNKIGQFLPGSAGGANSTTAADGDSLINPWDFILMLEGTILFTAKSTKLLDAHESAHASAPFFVYAQTAGHNSPGDEKNQRGEQWMPLWSNPCTLNELAGLLGEGRLQLGTANHAPSG